MRINSVSKARAPSEVVVFSSPPTTTSIVDLPINFFTVEEETQLTNLALTEYFTNELETFLTSDPSIMQNSSPDMSTTHFSL